MVYPLFASFVNKGYDAEDITRYLTAPAERNLIGLRGFNNPIG
jgi:hypothetical protein